MITEITKAQLLTLRLGQLRNEGKATSGQISMAKRNNVEIAINIAREARQVLGGMGITGEYPIMRHMMNLESVITYEGPTTFTFSSRASTSPARTLLSKAERLRYVGEGLCVERTLRSVSWSALSAVCIL